MKMLSSWQDDDNGISARLNSDEGRTSDAHGASHPASKVAIPVALEMLNFGILDRHFGSEPL